MDFGSEPAAPESGLVETPESQGAEPVEEAPAKKEKPPRRPRARKPKAAPAEPEQAAADNGDAPEAAE